MTKYDELNTTELEKLINEILQKHTDKDSLYKLSEIYDKRRNCKNNLILEEKIKEVLTPYKNGSIGLAQINPVAGDLEHNAKKIVQYINYAQKIGLDLVVFPELALMGYPIEDTIDRHPIIVEENV